MARDSSRRYWDPLDVLLVTPDQADARSFVDSLESGRVRDAISVVHSYEEALDFIHQRADYEDAARPDIVVLDIQLPETTGFDLLGDLKESPELRSIPVIVLSNSATEDDVRRSYELHANAFIQKPAESEEFADLVQSFERFWFSLVKLPSDG